MRVRSILFVVGIASASTLALAESPVPKKKKGATTETVFHQLDGQLASKLRPELRAKAAELARVLLERMSMLKNKSAKADALARQLAAELKNVGVSSEEDLALIIGAAMSEGGKSALATSQYLLGQIAAMQSLAKCNGEPKCIESIKPTKEMTADDVRRARERVAATKSSISEITAQDMALLQQVMETKRRLEEAISGVMRVVNENDAGVISALKGS